MVLKPTPSQSSVAVYLEELKRAFNLPLESDAEPFSGRLAGHAHRLNAVVGWAPSDQSDARLYARFGSAVADDWQKLIDSLNSLVASLKQEAPELRSLTVLVPKGTTVRPLPSSVKGVGITWHAVPESQEEVLGVGQPETSINWLVKATGKRSRKESAADQLIPVESSQTSPKPLPKEHGQQTTVADLLAHLAWLRKSRTRSPQREEAIYTAALRLWAESSKDSAQEAIRPKSVRVGLRKRTDKLIAVSRTAYRDSLGGGDSRRDAIAKTRRRQDRLLDDVTAFGSKSELFGGKPKRIPEASKPLCLAEVIAGMAAAKPTRQSRSDSGATYRAKLRSALKVIVAGIAAESQATTAKGRAAAQGAIDVGFSMLAASGDGLRSTPAHRALQKRHEEIAALVSARVSLPEKKAKRVSRRRR